MKILARAALAVHRRLLPAHSDVGWTPYLWLFYLSFLAWRWIVEPPAPRVSLLAAVCLVLFLGLYFNGYWKSGPRLLWNIAGIAVIGIILVPFNPGAMTFFVYAAGFCGAVGPPRRAWQVLAGLVGVVLATSFAFGFSWVWTVLTLCLTLMIGATNVFFIDASRKNADLRRSQEEVEQLAAVAERERIARDLHDLLGHTLTVITVKAELARRLSERGDARAAEEIADVERISRDAMAQVRAAVSGFRDTGLAGEVERARLACDARGIELSAHLDDASGGLGARGETALAMVLREAITNVVRHSGASRCAVTLNAPRAEAEGSGEIVLAIEDDGSGASPSGEGHGLASMRQRLEVLGGRLEVEDRGRGGGFKVLARLPPRRTGTVGESSDLGVPGLAAGAMPEPA